MRNKSKEKSKSANLFPGMEEEVLNFWDKSKIFEKSVRKKAPQGPSNSAGKDYVFYDGPPFATGTPHYGHIVASLMKDVVPRHWTMRGFRVERRWGWDCHGLPIENIVEKEIGIKSKKQIEEEVGVEKFNELCRSKVLGYVDEWKKVIGRLGRWADMENSYKTMDLGFMESVWWVFKELYNKGLIYEGYRAMHVCPRCETTLSQSEVAEGYKEVKDLSVIAKFELIDEPKTYVLAWTTTPWTLIGNAALTIGENINYTMVKIKNQKSKCKMTMQNAKLINEIYVLAKDRIEGVFKDCEVEILKEVRGRDLVGLKYRPLFGYYANDENLKNKKNGWKIYPAGFVTTEEGTGVVHIAPAFGEDDLDLGKIFNLPFIQHIGMDGVIKKEAGEFAGMSVKPADDHTKTDVEIIKYLARKNLLFAKEKYEHSYPHCWRCDTPLINYAASSWFVNIEKIKKQMLKTAKEISWSPEHIKEGRFGNWLESARDWSISRQRFWASVIPIWRCQGTQNNAEKHAEQRGKGECGNMKVVGSVKKLEELSAQKATDLHKHIIDKITFKCEKCGGKMARVPDVLDCWFESGSMPYAQTHYPFENKEKFEKNFPAQFIAEGVDQTRCWFYYLHAIANGLMDSRAYQNVIVNGIVLAEDGKKMSKRLKNYPDPSFIFEKYGADALRYYLLTSPVMLAENLNFSEKGVEEVLRKVEMILWNVYKFYEMYAEQKTNNQKQNSNLSFPRKRESRESTNNSWIPDRVGNDKDKSSNVLDQWIIAKLKQLISEVTENMDNYNLPKATRPIGEFINDLSTWYLRRSRDRFKSGDEEDKNAALNTMRFVLVELAKVMAPFMPFIAEQIWQKVTGFNFEDENKSVHLEGWPSGELGIRNRELGNILNEMVAIRKIVELGLAKRDEAGIKVRQPIASLKIKNQKSKIKNNEEYIKLIKDEINVKKVEFVEEGEGELRVELDTEITPELKQEGIKRELVRFINGMRKEAGMTINDRAVVYWQSKDKEIKQAVKRYKDEIMKDTLASEMNENLVDEIDIKKEVKVNGSEVWLGIKKL